MKYFYRSDIIDTRNGEEMSLIHLVVFHAKTRLIPTVHLLMLQPNYCWIWKSGSTTSGLCSLIEFTISRVEKLPFTDYNPLVSIIALFNYLLYSQMFDVHQVYDVHNTSIYLKFSAGRLQIFDGSKN